VEDDALLVEGEADRQEEAGLLGVRLGYRCNSAGDLIDFDSWNLEEQEDW